MICSHCGAAWDDTHEHEGCPVAAATERILQRPPPPPEGATIFNGAYVGRYDADGKLVGGRVHVDREGNLKWVAS